jgi:RHS repeat-associated protein
MDAKYTYDAFNRRVKTSVDPDGQLGQQQGYIDTYFVYDTDDVVLALQPSGALRNRYLHGPAVDEILADEQGSTVLWDLRDQFYNVRDLVNTAGTHYNHYDYDAFGVVFGQWANPSNRKHAYGFQSRERDLETELNYHRNRYLNRAIGRWISEDPIGFNAGDVNLNRFVGNSPLTLFDPAGLLNQVVKFVGSDAVGFDVGIGVTAPNFFLGWIGAALPIFSINFGGGIQGLVSCRSDEIAFYWYWFVGGGVTFGYPLGLNGQVNAVFVWNLRNAAAYLGSFNALGVSVGTGLAGVGGQIFSSDAADLDRWLNNKPLQGVHGFEIGWSPSLSPNFGGITASYQYFGMLYSKRLSPSNPLIKFLCCQKKGNNVRAGAAALGAFPLKEGFKMVQDFAKEQNATLKAAMEQTIVDNASALGWYDRYVVNRASTWDTTIEWRP